MGAAGGRHALGRVGDRRVRPHLHRWRAVAPPSTPPLRHIYLDEPHGDKGFWTQLETLAPESLFIWGRHDRLVSTGFMKHVERALPAARHVELDCGHIPQIERPRQTHAAIAKFLRAQRS